MSNDWQVGEKALCIKSGNRTREGVIYTVDDIQLPGELSHGSRNNTSVVYLRFAELRPFSFATWCGAERFRKIRPDEPKACEEEFRILLQLSKKRVKA